MSADLLAGLTILNLVVFLLDVSYNEVSHVNLRPEFISSLDLGKSLILVSFNTEMLMG